MTGESLAVSKAWFPSSVPSEESFLIMSPKPPGGSGGGERGGCGEHAVGAQSVIFQRLSPLGSEKSEGVGIQPKLILINAICN